jgi:Ca-activated chloride channel family protein
MKKKFLKLILTLLLTIVCLLTVAARPLAPQHRPDLPAGKDQTLSPFFVVLSDDPAKDALPLKSTRADVKIAGVVAGVKITQVYKNQGKKALEAIYVFPASSRAAVHAMRMTVGNRIIEAQIMKRQEARETYEAAKKAGQTTSLLEQQRPNVFQMNVANILPGDEVKVELNYLELLEPEDNVYEFVLPTVVGPRYSNQAAKGAPDTEKWVQNPYLHEGQAPPYTYGLSVEVNSALPIVKLASPSHDVEVKYSGKNAAQVRVKDETTAGNKDFVLRYGLAGDKIDTGLLLFPGREENFFLLMMEPPARVHQDAVVPREYIFIVDVSGSMNGFPIEISKALIQEIVTGLRPQDFFNILLFESDNAVLSESGSLPATEDNKKKAVNFIKTPTGGGGTEILKAFRRALALPRSPKTSRIVVVATDGFVHVEPQTFELIRQSLGEANLFPFGIGTSVNRHLIEGMARVGMGEPFVVLNPGEAPKQAARFRQYIDNPVLTSIKVSFEGFQAYDVEPPALPDLFARRPLTMLGKYRGSPTGAIVVKGNTAGGAYQQKIEVAPGQASPENSALRLLWARQRLLRLADLNRLKADDARVREVTDLGLKYSLMTAYTSFVAVDKVKRSDGQVVTVKQPLPLPEGVSDLAVGGVRPGGLRPKAFRGGASYQMAREAPPSRPLPPSTPKVDGAKAPAGQQVTVKIRKIGVTGALQEAAVRQALESVLPQITSCCQQYVNGVARPLTSIHFFLTVGDDGKVQDKPPLRHAALEFHDLSECLRNLFKTLTIAPPSGQAGTATVELTLEIK